MKRGHSTSKATVRTHPRTIGSKNQEMAQSIPSRFEQVVATLSDRIAVRTREYVLTYAELNAAANRMAHAILSLRGEGEEPVILLLEYNTSVFVALLGVLKTGKFYVTLDPSLPPKRLISILEDTHSSLIITDNANFPRFSKLAEQDVKVLSVEECASNPCIDNPGINISINSLVQILYTSGSTGQPKGIVQTHRCEFLRNHMQIERFHMSEEDRIVQLRSTVRFFPFPLLIGAAVYPWNVKKEGTRFLADWIVQEKITIYDSVPSVFRQFSNALSGRDTFSNLRVINVTGETVYNSDVELYKKHYSPKCVFINSLGTTETGGFRYNVISKQTQIAGNTVPVGYAIKDTEVLLIDDNGKPVGFDCVGQIAVKTPYMSNGYWRRPDLTEGAFIRDPRGRADPIYLTGDLGRMTSDGCLVHLGRKDLQIKIRGNRVEIAEVEAALHEHAKVKEAVVVARKDQVGDERLVAYIIPKAEPGPGVTELRNFLNERLPSYMMPAVYIKLSTFPRLTTGKVDRNALPPPSTRRPELDTPFVQPGTALEVEMARIWGEVLSIDRIGINDNFSDLGGNSLAAFRVISRVNDTFQIHLPVKSFLDSPTVAEMAMVVMQSDAKSANEGYLPRLLGEIEALSEDEARRLVVAGMQSNKLPK
jgi:amino acid adenylation domain-containing protein